MIELAHYIDHTILKPTTTQAEIQNLCREAAEYHFAAVCVPPPFVRFAKSELNRSHVKVATVIGFPFGYSSVKAKQSEIFEAINDGVDEVDVVINLISLRAGDYDQLLSEMKALTSARETQENITLKAIIESGVLSTDEIFRLCKLYSDTSIDYLKTSTGYAEKGATVEAVQLMRANLPSHIRIKASGGIRTAAFARELVAAGADRLGCSASVSIIKELADKR